MNTICLVNEESLGAGKNWEHWCVYRNAGSEVPPQSKTNPSAGLDDMFKCSFVPVPVFNIIL